MGFLAGKDVEARFSLDKVDRMCCVLCAFDKYGWCRFVRAAGSSEGALLFYHILSGVPADLSMLQPVRVAAARRWNDVMHNTPRGGEDCENTTGFLCRSCNRRLMDPW